MAKENENLESTEETVEEVVADKDAEQEHLDRQKEEEESIALASEKAKEKAKRAKTKKTRDAGKPSSGGRFLGGLALVAVSALVGAGAMYVSLGNKTTEETTLVSMKGDTVTVGDVFDSLKGSSQTQQSVLSATLQKALEKEYGSKVSKEDVDKAYKQASSFALGLHYLCHPSQDRPHLGKAYKQACNLCSRFAYLYPKTPTERRRTNCISAVAEPIKTPSNEIFCPHNALHALPFSKASFRVC